jgi:hypothetical protein
MQYIPGDLVMVHARATAVPKDWTTLRLTFETSNRRAMTLHCHRSTDSLHSVIERGCFLFQATVPKEAEPGIYVARRVLVQVPFSDFREIDLRDDEASFEIVAACTPTITSISFLVDAEH